MSQFLRSSLVIEFLLRKRNKLLHRLCVFTCHRRNLDNSARVRCGRSEGRESPSSRSEIIPGEGDFQFVRINELHSPPVHGPMDIATEEFSHLEIAGATIQMLLGPVNGKLKYTVEINPVAKLADAQGNKGTTHPPGATDPQFLVLSAGGRTVTRQQWCAVDRKPCQCQW